VSLPSTDPTKPSTHNTGGAVDLKIISLPDEIEARVKEIDRLIPALDRDCKSKEIYDLEFERHNIIAQNAQELNFGTTFDYADAEAAPDFYEKLAIQRELTAEELEARDNRRLLYNIMKTVGGMPFPYEWWHYNFRNQMAAVTCGGQIATYGSAELSVDNKKYETTLKNQRKGAIKIYEFIKSNDTGKLDIITQTNMGRTVINAVEKSGKYSETSLHQIEAIKPPDSKVAA
jgi:hypothetical protein